MKTKLNPEQVAARDAKRAKFRAIVKQVAAMSDAEKAELGKYGARKLDGGCFSTCNTMLLALQLPQGSVVAGFRQWLKAGRAVRKGEHGASIWVPIGGHKSTDAVTGVTATDSNGDKTGFIAGSVFDISQTDEIDTVTEVNEAQWNHLVATGETNPNALPAEIQNIREFQPA